MLLNYGSKFVYYAAVKTLERSFEKALEELIKN